MRDRDNRGNRDGPGGYARPSERGDRDSQYRGGDRVGMRGNVRDNMSRPRH